MANEGDSDGSGASGYSGVYSGVYSGAPLPGSRAPDSSPLSWRILIVDDKPHEADGCRLALEAVRGYIVEVEEYPLRALKRAREWQPDLIILDIAMPKMDGFELARQLKADGCPADLMFLTGDQNLDSEVDGLDLAEEFLTKPFKSQRLLARVRKILRRRRERALGQPAAGAERGAGSSRPVIDTVTRFAHVPHGKDDTLTPIEMQLLLRLLQDANKPVPYDELLQAVWEVSDERQKGRGQKRHPNRGLLNTNISRLRKKIERNPEQPELIINAPRIGYYYALKSDPE